MLNSQSSKGGGVVIICHRRTEHLKRVLDSLTKAQGIETWEVTFVAQNPTSEVMEIISSFSSTSSTILIQDLDSSQVTVRGAINRNLFAGLYDNFLLKKKDYVVVIEDDVLISPDFLTFVEIMVRKFGHESAFRGVNGLSSYTGPRLVGDYARFSQGFMWGWATTSSNFRKLLRFWNGNEDAHWDHYIEPYLRTGFVINPVFSKVDNIGFDETASHVSSQDPIAHLVHQSYCLGLDAPSTYKEERDVNFRVRDDYIYISGLSLLKRLKIRAVMTLSFYIYQAGIKASRITHFWSRRIRLWTLSVFFREG